MEPWESWEKYGGPAAFGWIVPYIIAYYGGTMAIEW